MKRPEPKDFCKYEQTPEGNKPDYSTFDMNAFFIGLQEYAD